MFELNPKIPRVPTAAIGAGMRRDRRVPNLAKRAVDRRSGAIRTEGRRPAGLVRAHPDPADTDASRRSAIATPGPSMAMVASTGGETIGLTSE